MDGSLLVCIDSSACVSLIFVQATSAENSQYLEPSSGAPTQTQIDSSSKQSIDQPLCASLPLIDTTRVIHQSDIIESVKSKPGTTLHDCRVNESLLLFCQQLTCHYFHSPSGRLLHNIQNGSICFRFRGIFIFTANATQHLTLATAIICYLLLY